MFASLLLLSVIRFFSHCKQISNFVTLASNIKLWGGSEQAMSSFSGACDYLAVDNDYLQLQLRGKLIPYPSFLKEMQSF